MQENIDKSENCLVLYLNGFFLLASIFFYDLLTIQIYMKSPFKEHSAQLFMFIVAQCICAWLIGEIADRCGRKKILLLTQSFGLIFIVLSYFYGFKWPFLVLFGLFYCPDPPARGILLNNFVSKFSAMQIITLSLIIQFSPWAILPIIPYESDLFWFSCYILLLAFTVLKLFFLNDHKFCHEKIKNTSCFVSKTAGKRLFWVGWGLLFAQIVFFSSFEGTEYAEHPEYLFSSIGCGAVVGALFSFLYRKIPHLSVLTLCYGVGLMLSSVIMMNVFAFTDTFVDIAFMMALFGTLGGFYLPFVFDVALHAYKSSYRSHACGKIEAIQTISALIGTAFIHGIVSNGLDKSLFIIISFFCFIFAFILQKRGENFPDRHSRNVSSKQNDRDKN